MIRVSILLVVLAIFATAVEAQAQQVVATAQKAAQEPEITDYPKYPIEYPADWKGPRIAGPQTTIASTSKPATMTAFKKLSNMTKANLVSSATKSSSAGSTQTHRVISNQPAQISQPRIISPSYNRYPSFYSPSGCLTGR